MIIQYWSVIMFQPALCPAATGDSVAVPWPPHQSPWLETWAPRDGAGSGWLGVPTTWNPYEITMIRWLIGCWWHVNTCYCNKCWWVTWKMEIGSATLGGKTRDFNRPPPKKCSKKGSEGCRTSTKSAAPQLTMMNVDMDLNWNCRYQ